MANRSQTPVNPGAFVPGFLSHLRCLLAPWRNGKVPDLALFPPFFFFCQPQNFGSIVLGSEQFHHLRLRFFLVGIQLFILCQQSGILLFQRLHKGQLFQTKAVKKPICCLTGNDLTCMLVIKLRFRTANDDLQKLLNFRVQSRVVELKTICE